MSSGRGGRHPGRGGRGPGRRGGTGGAGDGPGGGPEARDDEGSGSGADGAGPGFDARGASAGFEQTGAGPGMGADSHGSAGIGSRSGRGADSSGAGNGSDGCRGAEPADEAAVDPDVDLHVPGQRAEAAGRRGLLVLAVIAAGGALGAVARHALELWLPARGAAGFPWGIFTVNVSGCALIGVLMALIGEGGRAARAPALLRPFLGVGLLGGFTSFSAYALDAAGLLRAGPEAYPTAAGYVGGTLLGALAAVWAGAAGTRALTALPALRER